MDGACSSGRKVEVQTLPTAAGVQETEQGARWRKLAAPSRGLGGAPPAGRWQGGRTAERSREERRGRGAARGRRRASLGRPAWTWGRDGGGRPSWCCGAVGQGSLRRRRKEEARARGTQRRSLDETWRRRGWRQRQQGASAARMEPCGQRGSVNGRGRRLLAEGRTWGRRRRPREGEGGTWRGGGGRRQRGSGTRSGAALSLVPGAMREAAGGGNEGEKGMEQGNR